jgi:hypothetical protein
MGRIKFRDSSRSLLDKGCTFRGGVVPMLCVMLLVCEGSHIAMAESKYRRLLARL